jgi:hypothetical protein
MYYTASSVIAALKASTKCNCKGLENIKCPKDGCNISPGECTLAETQECIQSVIVFDKDNNNPLILQFTFPVSAADNDGFINQNNASLKRLIYKKIINSASLTSI